MTPTPERLIRITPREELLRAADELVSVIPFPTRRVLAEENDTLAECRQRIQDLASLTALRARAVLSVGAIVAMLNELFAEAPDGDVLSFTSQDTAMIGGGNAPVMWPAIRFAVRIAEIAMLPPDVALLVWSHFLHLLAAHYPFSHFFGHAIERTPDGVQLRRATTP